MKRLAAILMGSLCLAGNAVADIPELSYGQIFVTAVNATEGIAGGTSRLRLTISNEMAEDFQFLGVSTPVATDSALVARIGRTKSVVFGSARVPRDDVLDLNTSHMWIRLTNLTHTLAPGDEFLVELNFAGFRISAVAHVHG